MRKLSMAVALVAALGVASTAAGADPELGKQVWAKRCATCHAADGKGNAKMAEKLGKIPDLTTSGAKTEAELRKAIAEGKPPMPAFGKSLKKDELEAVVQFARTLTGNKK